jgi:hypothetical protein
VFVYLLSKECAPHCQLLLQFTMVQYDANSMGYHQIPTSLVLPVQKNIYSSGSSVAPAPISAHGLKEAAI